MTKDIKKVILATQKRAAEATASTSTNDLLYLLSVVERGVQNSVITVNNTADFSSIVGQDSQIYYNKEDKKMYFVKNNTFFLSDGTIFYPLTGEAESILNTTWISTYAPASYVWDATPGAEGIRVKANDPITNMYQMFSNSAINNSDISSWDVSSVTNMTAMFNLATSFNQNISSWNVSNVTAMNGMFNQATAFNQPIGSWIVSNVTNMASMFIIATSFNQNIGSWNVSNVTNMNGMFKDAPVFDQDISSWDVSSVTDMVNMFNGASVFDQDISGWDVLAASVAIDNSTPPTDFDLNTNASWTGAEKPLWGTDGTGILYPLSNTATDPTSSTWRTANPTYQFFVNVGILMPAGSPITSMDNMFAVASNPFNDPDISSWDVSTVNNMSFAFSLNNSFNQDLSSWNVSNVTKMNNMFNECYAFNQDLSSWNTSIVTDMSSMFYDASVFNNGGQPLTTNGNQWNVSNVTSMNRMFATSGTAAFNQDISSWDVSSVTDMEFMFAGAIAFDQNLNAWDVTNIPSLPSNFATGATLFTVDEHPIWGTDGIDYLVDPTYGTLVAYYNAYGYNNANGYELNAVASNYISALSPTYENRYAIDSYFASKIAAGTTITYVFTGNFSTSVHRYAIADLLTCNVRAINTTTIGPSAFANSPPGDNTAGLQTHWHQETSGNTLSGGDYSFLALGDEIGDNLRNFSTHNFQVAPFPTSGVGQFTQGQGVTGSPKVAIYIV